MSQPSRWRPVTQLMRSQVPPPLPTLLASAPLTMTTFICRVSPIAWRLLCGNSQVSQKLCEHVIRIEVFPRNPTCGLAVMRVIAVDLRNSGHGFFECLEGQQALTSGKVTRQPGIAR